MVFVKGLKMSVMYYKYASKLLWVQFHIHNTGKYHKKLNHKYFLFSVHIKVMFTLYFSKYVVAYHLKDQCIYLNLKIS